MGIKYLKSISKVLNAIHHGVSGSRDSIRVSFGPGVMSRYLLPILGAGRVIPVGRTVRYHYIMIVIFYPAYFSNGCMSDRLGSF